MLTKEGEASSYSKKTNEQCGGVMSKLLWGVKELAEALGRTPRSIRADLHRELWSRIPRPIRLNGSLAWRPQDVEAWAEEMAIKSGAFCERSSSNRDEAAPRRRPGRPTKEEQLHRKRQKGRA